MDSVYGSNVSGTAPAAPAVPVVGFPRAGNSLTGEKATRPGPYWYHMITQEQLNVIIAAGLTPDAADLTQLQQAIVLLAGLPAGTEIDWGGTSAPAGFLKLNGSVIAVSSAPNLVANTYCGDANNATASFYYRCTDPLNPTTTRNVAGAYYVLKDARGRFPRALSDGSSIDSGRSAWSYQDYAIPDHTHSGGMPASGAPGIPGGSGGSPYNAGSTSGVSGTNVAGENRPTNHPALRCVKK